ncbi:hypothetical protein [Rhizorhabdus wittichii]|uniref:glucosamine inositolphosphorylceramide transferase family protein n=1 Tax=Rhizorhabdus wittichii TaxID=160791 RepID=UPI00035C5646|nr:hypothetical protein [Rhizorhabdus wittichii]
MPLRKDIWRPAIVERRMSDIVATGSIEGAPLHWLPALPPYSFLADPFGLWRDGRFHLFVERFDYRDRRGVIELIVHDAGLAPLYRCKVLSERWHLSYPFVFEADGQSWMLPEAHRSGGLILYRCFDFPDRWERAARIELDCVPVDATPFWHDGLWWLFYAAADDRHSKVAHLHVAFSERLTDGWRPHPSNPVRRDSASARPGGTPILLDGRIMLPVQDCSHTYGGGIAMLAIERLTPDDFVAHVERSIAPPAGLHPFDEGMHTLSAAGEVTLIDVKRTMLSLHGLAIEARRETQRLFAPRRR